MRCLHVFKKGKLVPFLSLLIFNFTVNIVNNTASLYVEYSIKHFYFKHLVKYWKTIYVFPTRHLFVGHREVKVGSRRGQTEKWMYHTLWENYGKYYLNVGKSTLTICLWCKVLFCWSCFFLIILFFASMFTQEINKQKKHLYFILQQDVLTWLIFVGTEMVS